MSEQETVRATDLYDVVCDKCKARHPVSQAVGHALACMDKLNNTDRPCPACGVQRRWVLERLPG